jgi:hypothetical protein
VCVRHPLEVVASLGHRGDGRGEIGLELWLRYYRRLLATVGPDDWLVTHYDAYFHDPHAELQRVGSWLGLDVAAPTIRAAVEVVRDELRHERFAAGTAGVIDVPEVSDCYRLLCDAAGPVLRAAHAEATPGAGGARFLERVLRRRADALEAAIAAREDRLAELSDRVAALENRGRVLAASAATSAAAASANAAAAAAAAARADAAESQLHDLTHSRAWQLLQWLWRLRLGLAPIGSWRERLWRGLAVPGAEESEPPPTSAAARSSR